MHDTQQTHDAECWRYHHGCAIARIEAVMVMGLTDQMNVQWPQGSRTAYLTALNDVRRVLRGGAE